MVDEHEDVLDTLEPRVDEAAATDPIVRAHLEAARVLKIAVDKRPRTTN